MEVITNKLNYQTFSFSFTYLGLFISANKKKKKTGSLPIIEKVRKKLGDCKRKLVYYSCRKTWNTFTHT